MRRVVRGFVTDAAEQLPLAAPVVEIGSRPAEGQEDLADLRPLFPGLDYIGCDIQPGANVDRIEDVHRMTFSDGSVGTVICVDTLEHVADPLRAVREMHRVLRPGGVAILTSVMFFPIHEHPADYWRFTPSGFELLLAPFETSVVFSLGAETLPEGVFGVGVKGASPGLSRRSFPRTDAACRRWGAGRPVDLGPIRLGVTEVCRLAIGSVVASAFRRRRDQPPKDDPPPPA